MSGTTHTHRRRPDGTPAVRATRYLLGIVRVVVAAWKAAARWLTGDRGAHPALAGGIDEVAIGVGQSMPTGPVADVTARLSRSGSRWTAEDDAYLAEHPDEPPDAIAHHLGRTPSAVVARKATLRREGRT